MFFSWLAESSVATARNGLLLATGIFHLPPEIPGVRDCLGHSMFFCKDCDGFRVREKRIAICGANDEAVDYALEYAALFGLRHYCHQRREDSPWSKQHAQWLGVNTRSR